MKLIKTFIMPLLLVVVCGLLLRSTYVEVKARAIDQLNGQQMVMAETAARGIESFFEHCTEFLTQLSKMSEIASLDESGKQLMRILYRTHANEIKGISRVSASGRIIYTFPEIPGGTGADLSSQEHIQTIMQTHQPVVSDVFDSVQGFVSIAIHVPVFKDEVFQGSLAVLIPFDQLARNYLEPIKIGKDGYAWIISHKGIELYCPVPGHIGKSVFDNCKDFPTILSMAREMVKGKRGTTAYFFDRVRGETVESLKKQAVYVPVHLGKTFWSIVVATPEDEVLENIQGFRDRWFLIVGVLILIFIVWTSCVLRAFKILKEEEKRKRMEEALRESEELYRTALESSNDGVAIIQDGRYVYLNQKLLDTLGRNRDEMMSMAVGTTLHPDDRTTVLDYYDKYEKGQPTPDHFEIRVYKPDGAIVHAEVSPVEVTYQGKKSILGYFRNITERIRAEEDLRRNRRFLSDLIEHSGALICAKDRDGRYELVNRKWEEVTGWKRQDALGRTDEELFPGPVGEQFRLNDLEVMESGSVLEKEEILETEYGKRFFISIKFPLRGDDDAFRGICGMITEITERKQTEEELSISSNRLTRAEIISRSGNWEFDLESKRVFASDGARKIYGLLKAEWSIPEVQKIPLPEYRGMLDRALRDLVEENRPYDVEFKIRRSDTGEVADIHSVAEYDRRRNVVFGIIQDITEQKWAESQRQAALEALGKSESLMRAITDSAQDAIMMMAPTGCISFWNPAAEQIFGYTTEEAIGQILHQFLAPRRYREAYQAAFSRFKEIGQGEAADKSIELQACRKNGEEFPIELSLSAIHLENGWHAVGIIRDITSRKRAETALRESEARLTAFMEFVPALTLIKDHELRPIYANRKYRELFPVDEWLGKKPHETFPVEMAELMVRRETEALHKGYTYYEETWLDKYQVPHVYQAQKFRIDIQDSEPLLGSIISDITDQRRMEQERQELRERLYRAEKMEALGTLAGGVAHDLNNVLGVLVGYSELLLEKIPGDSPSRRYVANILKSGERGSAIIQDLLTMARRGMAISEVVNLNSVISEYFRTLEFERLKADHEGVTFNADLDRDLMNIKGSPVHLGKTLMNLLINAAEAIEGGGEISIRTENCYLDRPVRGYDTILEGDYVVLTVTDNGKGISPADLGKIFEPFYTKKVMGRSGTGLGLAVVWGTVKDHGGYIDVRSDEGKGSTFTIYFPVTREELTRDQQKISPEQYLGKGESILVVDDVEGQRELAVSMLTRLGYRVDAVSSGEEAVAYLKSNKVDLLVLDMIMEPGIDGLETYQRVLEIHPKQKAVIVSGFSETDRVKKAQSLGAGAYVKKPYVLERLGLAIKRELDRTAGLP